MSEIEKMYENAGIKPYRSKEITFDPTADSYKANEHNVCYGYPPFTAEKQLSLLKFCLKWGQVHILQGIDDEYRIENSCYRQGYQSTLEAAIANYINEKWNNLTEQEKTQIAEILRG